MKLFICIFLFALFISFGNSTAQIDPLIRIEPSVDTVDFGFVLLGENNRKNFTIINGSANPVWFRGSIAPYFSIEKSLTVDDFEIFRQFSSFPSALPEVIIQPTIEHSITVDYTPRDTSLLINEAEGLLSIRVSTVGNEEIKQEKQYVVKGYRSKTWLATKRTSYNFDSVYVNTTTPKVFRWSLLNLSNALVSPSTDIAYYTPNDSEFSFASVNAIPSKDTREFELLYRPKGRGRDSARFWLRYERGGGIETLPIELSGFGVEQVITTTAVTVDANPVATNNIIDLGDMNWGTKKNVVVRFKNDGNIVYSVVKQGLSSVSGGVEVPTLSSITSQYPYTPIFENDEYGISLEITPSVLGLHTIELALETNLLNRGYHGVNAADAVKKIVFRVNGVGALLQANQDTLRLGDVPVSQQSSCRLTATKSLQVKNVGSTNLDIQSTNIISSFSPFRILSTGAKTVNSDSTTDVVVEFEPTAIGNFVDSLVILSNSVTGSRNVLYVQGTGVQAQTVSPIFDEILAKPGTDIFVPLRLNASLEGITTLQQQLQYDPQILEFKGYRNNGTKIQNIPNQFISIAETSKGNLPITISTPQSNFTNSDTLVILHFRVYLGEKLSTPIQFVSSQFGNTACPNFLNVTSIPGRITVDSICGLDYKTTLSTVSIGAVVPNPFSDVVRIQLDSKESQSISITLLSPIGTVVHQQDVELTEGTHLLPITAVKTLQKGLYILSIRANNGIHQQLLIKE
jgi:hypothetical protein